MILEMPLLGAIINLTVNTVAVKLRKTSPFRTLLLLCMYPTQTVLGTFNTLYCAEITATIDYI